MGKYYRAYCQQKHGAAVRGVEFKLTFKEWCDFWGEDVDRRGSGPDDLSMQRFADTGPYAIGNIRKGTPRENAVTAGHMTRLRNTTQAKQELEFALDQAMFEPSIEPFLFDPVEGDGDPLELFKLGYKSSHKRRYCF